MAALDFPDNPTVGQIYDKWSWNGTVWVLVGGGSGGGGGGSGFTFSQDTPPTATTVGQTWYETDTGDCFVWVNDGTSSQWVEFAPGGNSGFTFVGETTPTALQIGDTWFDTSTGAMGGTSWVAIDEGTGELVWVQYAPTSATQSLTTVFFSTFNSGALASGSANPVALTTPGTLTLLSGAIYVATLNLSAYQGAVTQCAWACGPFGAWWQKTGGWSGVLSSVPKVGDGSVLNLTTVNIGDPAAAVTGGGGGYLRIEKMI